MMSKLLKNDVITAKNNLIMAAIQIKVIEKSMWKFYLYLIFSFLSTRDTLYIPLSDLVKKLGFKYYFQLIADFPQIRGKLSLFATTAELWEPCKVQCRANVVSPLLKQWQSVKSKFFSRIKKKSNLSTFYAFVLIHLSLKN